MNISLTTQKLVCYHCGDACPDDSISSNGKIFCCEGCKLVYELLAEHHLNNYYRLDQHPGTKPAKENKIRFSWLDDPAVVKQLLTFSEKDIAKVRFSLPQIHCTSCIWLLENLHNIKAGILHAAVDFMKKEAVITFNNKTITLREVVVTLAEIGYAPDLRFSDLKKKKASVNNSLLYKIGVAGFCFGNIMMLSFPEYLTGVSTIEPALRHFFSYLNLVLALPVFFYSAGDYFTNSWKAAKQKYFSIDLPIAFGLLAMLFRSIYEITSGVGPGYFDSMTGLVFFLLIGRYFQDLTYKNLSFERDYKSYFPVATTVIKEGRQTFTAISNLKQGDHIVIHSDELVPADAILLKGTASIDYSFVTGEAMPVSKETGDLIYAGAKQKGASIELVVQQPVEQSYLTQLWNHDSFQKNKQTGLSAISDRLSKYFTLSILLIALATAVYWFPKDLHRGVLACTAILIIACPCALALTVPFTFGNIIRTLGKNHFYLKNASVIESMAKTNTIVFDKTGTVTLQQDARIRFEGRELSATEWSMIKSLTAQSIHPLSKKITGYLSGFETYEVEHFAETSGAGITGVCKGATIRIGSASFVGAAAESFRQAASTDSVVYITINQQLAGNFQISGNLRQGIKEQLQQLNKDFHLFLLSGDHEGERAAMKSLFPENAQLCFQQSPLQKLRFIQGLQQQKKQVMMIGDGLNDAGALQQSDTGITVCDDLTQFSPASDAILKGSAIDNLKNFIQFSRSAISIIWFTFGISLIYNVVGISFAVQGTLSPMMAAILMPLSSISVILITTLAVRWKASSLGL